MKKKYLGAYPRDEDRFAGEYIAVAKNNIIAHGKTVKGVIEKAKKLVQNPLLVKVPTLGWKQSMVLWAKRFLKGKK